MNSLSTFVEITSIFNFNEEYRQFVYLHPALQLSILTSKPSLLEEPRKYSTGNITNNAETSKNTDTALLTFEKISSRMKELTFRRPAIAPIFAPVANRQLAHHSHHVASHVGHSIYIPTTVIRELPMPVVNYIAAFACPSSITSSRYSRIPLITNQLHSNAIALSSKHDAAT